MLHGGLVRSELEVVSISSVKKASSSVRQRRREADVAPRPSPPPAPQHGARGPSRPEGGGVLSSIGGSLCRPWLRAMANPDSSWTSMGSSSAVPRHGRISLLGRICAGCGGFAGNMVAKTLLA